MNENLLHLLWRTRRFNHQNLKTTAGETINILHTGKLNAHNGPDFLEACIEINGTRWHGSVEMHVKSSDWNKHAHTSDENYNNVILHAVYENDAAILDINKNILPCIELKNRIAPEVIARYGEIISSDKPILCATHLPSVPDIVKKNWWERLFILRLEEQAQKMKTWAATNKNDWDSVLWHLIFRYSVSNANREAMVRLFESLPIQHLKRLKNNPIALEAILIGQAGFLETDSTDDYPKALQTEYNYQKEKLGLEPLKKILWQTRSIYNAASVCIRLSQLAQLLAKSDQLFSSVAQSTDLKALSREFSVASNDYWFNHNAPDVLTQFASRRLGQSAIDVLIINAFLPFKFFYGTQIGDENIKNSSLMLFEYLKAEKNSVIDVWNAVNVFPENARESLALIHLKKYFCDSKACFSCNIGAHIFTTS